jgi:hypothetical protein
MFPKINIPFSFPLPQLLDFIFHPWFVQFFKHLHAHAQGPHTWESYPKIWFTGSMITLDIFISKNSLESNACSFFFPYLDNID